MQKFGVKKSIWGWGKHWPFYPKIDWSFWGKGTMASLFWGKMDLRCTQGRTQAKDLCGYEAAESSLPDPWCSCLEWWILTLCWVKHEVDCWCTWLHGPWPPRTGTVFDHVLLHCIDRVRCIRVSEKFPPGWCRLGPCNCSSEGLVLGRKPSPESLKGCAHTGTRTTS